MANLEEYNEKIWLQHPEETDDQYRFFFNYYLSQKSDTRSILMSYKLYMIEEKGKKEEDVKGLTTYSKRYGCWAKGEDSNGNKINGLHTWEERAKAYFTNVFNDKMNLLLERRGKVVEEEYEHGEKLLKHYNSVYDAFVLQMEVDKAEAKAKGIPFDSSHYLTKLQKLVKVRDEIAVFLRRSVGLTDRVTTDEIAKSLSQNKEVSIEWVVPETKYEENEIDKMSDEEFEKLLVNKLSQ